MAHADHRPGLLRAPYHILFSHQGPQPGQHPVLLHVYLHFRRVRAPEHLLVLLHCLLETRHPGCCTLQGWHLPWLIHPHLHWLSGAHLPELFKLQKWHHALLLRPDLHHLNGSHLLEPYTLEGWHLPLLLRCQPFSTAPVQPKPHLVDLRVATRDLDPLHLTQLDQKFTTRNARNV